ncbi:MAG: RteC protein [Mucilaginibacter sp.]|nr:RteC protein [Mucilaginibacter sp.]
MLLSETQNLDPAFSTNGDYAYAKLIALERLQEYLITELIELDRPCRKLYAGLGWHGVNERHLEYNLKDRMEAPKLRWTGESINLLELAYGMWLTGQINNGNVSVTEIAEFLELSFGLEIGAPHRR